MTDLLTRLKALFKPPHEKHATLEACLLFPDDDTSELRWVGIDKVWLYEDGSETIEYKRRCVFVAAAHEDDITDDEVKPALLRGDDPAR